MGELQQRYTLLSGYIALLNAAIDVLKSAIAPNGDFEANKIYFNELKTIQQTYHSKARYKNERAIKDLDQIWENLENIFSNGFAYQKMLEKILHIMENPVISKAYNENYLQPVYNGATYVYVMLFSNNEVKIGISVQPEIRKKALENERRTHVVQMITSEGMPFDQAKKVERRAHDYFAQRKIWGEYFNITFGDAVECVDNLCKEVANEQ